MTQKSKDARAPGDSGILGKTIASLLMTAGLLFVSGCGSSESRDASLDGNCSVVAASLAAEARQGAPARLTGAVNPAVTSRRFIVKMADGAVAGASALSRVQSLSSALAEGAAPKVDQVGADTYTLEYDRELSSEEVNGRLPGVEYVEPDYEVRHTLASNDKYLSSQWAHSVVKSAEAWNVSRGGSVVVAVLDSGVDYTHPDLAGNIWTNPGETVNGRDDDGNGYVDDVRGWNFANGNPNVKADDASSYHGTHVGGTIGAVGNNGIGISGHAQVVKIMPLKFLSAKGSGYTSNAIRGIDYAIAKKASIINNSWGGGNYSQALSDAINRARAAGILFVAAAGNNGDNNDAGAFYPASYPHDNVISVASTDKQDRLSSFSNYGRTTVDIAAPGSSIYSTKNGSTYQYLSGTSMATPLVSGVLATMRALRPDLSYAAIRGALLKSVDPVAALSGRTVSNGRINAYRALTSIQWIRILDAGPGSSVSCQAPT